MLIAVNGHAQKAAPAERGTVRVSVSLQDSTPDTIFQEVSRLHSQLRDDAQDFVDGGEATWWSADQVRTAIRQRYLKDSDVQETYYVAAADLSVKFKDFDALANWISEITPREGVSVNYVNWALTEKRRIELTERARTSAVHDAQRRAEAYAKAAGFAHVELRALYEPGLRPAATGYGDTGFGAATTRAAAGGAQGSNFEMKPDDITITANVTADFDAHGAATA